MFSSSFMYDYKEMQNWLEEFDCGVVQGKTLSAAGSLD